MSRKLLKLFFHDHCFDGAASAALFRHYYRSHVDSDAEVELVGMAHAVDDPWAGVELSGDDNACVDFRYCSDPGMTWWFDHHISAFQGRHTREHFDAHPSPQRRFDPDAKSCALFMARTLERDFGFVLDDYDRELAEWAEITDGALFESPTQVVTAAEPALKLSTWLAQEERAEHRYRLITELGRVPMAELVKRDYVADSLAVFLDKRARGVELARQHTTRHGTVAVCDLLGHDSSGHNNFALYAIEPEAAYSVTLRGGPKGLTISVGFNPWSGQERRHHVASLCERYGGGGHPAVGGINIDSGQEQRAREIAAELTRALNASE